MATPTVTGGMCVRNTFIDFDHEEDSMQRSGSRRSASLPPNLKMLEKAEEDALEGAVCSNSGLTEIAPKNFDFAHNGSNSDSCSETEGSTEASSGDSSRGDITPEQEMLISVPKQRTKLKSSSEAWMPSSLMSSGVSCQQCKDPVGKDIYEAVNNISLQLLGAGCISKYTISNVSDGFELRVSLDNQWQVHSMERTLTSAKTSLLSWAENTTNLYILGYCGKPFLPLSTGPGFIATVCPMWDESTTCWESFKWGSCARGATCRWKHPSQAIALTMRVDVEPFAYYNQGYCMDSSGQALNYAM